MITAVSPRSRSNTQQIPRTGLGVTVHWSVAGNRDYFTHKGFYSLSISLLRKRRPAMYLFIVLSSSHVNPAAAG